MLYSNEIASEKKLVENTDYSLLDFWKEESFLTHSKHWQKKLATENLTEEDLIARINKSDSESEKLLKMYKKRYFNIEDIEDNKELDRNYLTLPFLKEFDRKMSLQNIRSIDIEHSRNQLHEMLMNNVIRTFIKEVNDFRQVAESKSPIEQYEEFLQKNLFNRKDLLCFYLKHITLFRINSDMTYNYINYISSIIKNVENDYQKIKGHFGLENTLNKIDINYGDTHENGKSVAVLSFGEKDLVFKPKNLYVTKCFNKFVSYLNTYLDKKLYTVNHLLFEEYCIEEKIPYASCVSEGDIKDYYYRFGSLLGIIYMLNGNDIHYENIIAYKGFPVIIDLETLFNNQLEGVFERNATNKVKYFLANSIIGTGMLPKNSFPDKYGKGFDLSALGSICQKVPVKNLYIANDMTSNLTLKELDMEISETKNIPQLNDEKVNPYEYNKYILDGFENILKVLQNIKKELIKEQGALDIFQDIQVRTVIRNTDFYANILFDSLSPGKTSDVLLREMVVDRLYLSYLPENILKEEKLSLLNNDVPVFYNNTSTKDIYTNNSIYKDIYKSSPLELVKKKFKRLDEDSIKKQCQILNDILLVNSDVEDFKRQRTTLKYIKNDNHDFRNELITKEINKLVDFSYKGDYDFQDINWEGMSLTLSGSYEYNALNINYSDGLSGMFQLLLYEGNDSIDRLVKNSLLSNIKIHDNLYSSYYDILSALKPLVILVNRYNDIECMQKIFSILEAYTSNMKKIQNLDFFSGLSGILSLLRDAFLYCKNIDVKRVLKKAIVMTETQILKNKNRVPKDIGFSHGNSGIIYGLLRGYEITNNNIVLKFVMNLIKKNDESIFEKYRDFTLSHGLLGVLLSRALYKKYSPDYSIKEHINFLKKHYYFDNHSICNGASGFIETSNILEELGFNDLTNEKNRIISHILDLDTFLSGFPNNIDSWNLLLGKAGFLYALKRHINQDIINLI